TRASRWSRMNGRQRSRRRRPDGDPRLSRAGLLRPALRQRIRQALRSRRRNHAQRATRGRARARAPRRSAGRDAGVRWDGAVAPLPKADALLISAAPADGRDPVLAIFEDEIARAPRLKSAVYLSSLGVYGDSGGAWIDESAQIIPALARRGRTRIDAELNW